MIETEGSVYQEDPMTSVEPIRNPPSRGARRVVTIAVLGLLAAATPGSAEGRFRVIVNAELSGEAVKKNQLSTGSDSWR